MQPHYSQTSWRQILVLCFGAVCISFAAIFVKLLGRDAMGPTSIGFWRAGLGAVILFAWSTAAGLRPVISRNLLGWSALAGFIFFLDLFFWHRSIIYSGAGMATILANTQVFVVAALGYLVFRERLTLKFFAAAAAAIVGVVLLIGVGSDIEFTSEYLSGIIFGLLTGVVYGSYIVTLKRVGHRDDSPDFRVFMAWTSLFTAFYLAVAALFEKAAFIPPDVYSLAILAALALVAQAVGWWIITTTLPRLDAARGALILLLQPVLATVWGVVFFAEQLSPSQIIGAMITLGAIYVGSVRRRISQRQKGRS